MLLCCFGKSQIPHFLMSYLLKIMPHSNIVEDDQCTFSSVYEKDIEGFLFESNL